LAFPTQVTYKSEHCLVPKNKKCKHTYQEAKKEKTLREKKN
jgi:hypothetical protein